MSRFLHGGSSSLRLPARILRTALAAGLIAGVSLVAPRAASAQRHVAASFVDSGALTLVYGGAAGDLDPASEQDYGSDTIVRNIADTLVGFDGSHMDRYVPKLAVSYSSNADKSVWTFHLRHGVRFHTGRCCMTADDVRYSIGRTVTAGLAGSYLYGRFITNPAKQIQVLDPYTVQFALGRPQPTFLAALTSEYVGLILDAQAARAHQDAKTHDAHAWLQFHDVATGPYTIQSWQHGQQVVLTRFAGYWGGWNGPHVSTVYVRTIPEASTRRELLERGQADITFSLTPQDYQALSANPKVSVSTPYATEVDYIIMTQAGPLASPYARQALSYAFNYDAYIKGILGGYGKRAYGPIPSALLGYNGSGFHYQTDLAQAKALLQKAGIAPGTTLTYAYGSNGERAGLILQAQLAQLGITLKLQHMADAAFSTMFFGTEPASQRPNLMYQTWWPDYNDPYDMCSPLIYSKSAGASGANGGFYHDKTVDTLLDAMKNADQATLIRDATQLQDVTGRQDPPAIWVAEPAQVTVMAKSLKGFVANPIELNTYGFYSLYR